MIYGYSRVSTAGQADNNSREAQEKMLREAGATEIYHDVMSGGKIDRTELTKLINKLESGDKFVVTKMDRFARTMIEGFTLIQELMSRGITVQILNIGTLDNSTTGKLITNIFLAFAEFERDSIRDRMMEGKAIAKQKPDFHEGRPKTYTTKQLNHAIDLLTDNSYKQVAEITGISISTLARERRKRKAQELQAKD